MFLPSGTALLLLLAGGSVGLPVKGGDEKSAAKGWEQPKDWDWSVSPGRLIPVSEVTDDLPTPGYRMQDLQQRVPVQQTEQQEAKVEETSLNDTALPQQTTQPAPTSSTAEKDPASSSATTTGRPSAEEERVPVIEETMREVILPEICSITGIGCRDEAPARVTTESGAHSESTETVRSSEKITESPGLFFLENSKRVKTVDNAISTPVASSTESALQEEKQSSVMYDHQTEKTVGDQIATGGSTEHHEIMSTETVNHVDSAASNSDNRIQQAEEKAASTTGSPVSQHPPLKDPQEESVQKQEVSDVQRPLPPNLQRSIEDNDNDGSSEESIQKQEVSDVQRPLPPNLQRSIEDNDNDGSSEESIQKQEVSDVQRPLPPNLQRSIEDNDNDGSSEESVQEELVPQQKEIPVFKKDYGVSGESNEDTSEENESNRIPAQRPLDVSKGKEHQEQLPTTTTAPSSDESSGPKLDGTTEQQAKPVASEEEKKLMETSSFNTSNTANLGQSDEPSSPSIGERITNYWNAATQYVSKVLYI